MKTKILLTLAGLAFLGSCTTPTSPTQTSSANDSSGSSRTNYTVTTNYYTYAGYLGGTGSGSADGQFYSPQDVLITASGDIFVADYMNYRVQKFDSNGAFVTKWGSYGATYASKQFLSLVSITTDVSGVLYVCDEQLNKVVCYDTSGTYLKAIPNFTPTGGSAAEIIMMSSCVVVGTNVFIADINNYAGTIKRFDVNGNFITNYIGSNQSGGGVFAYPTQIGLQGANFLVASGIPSTLKKYDSSFGYLSDFISTSSVKDIEEDGAGFIYLSFSGSVKKYTSGGSFLGSWGDVTNKNGQGVLSTGRGFAISKTGRVYIADSSAHQIKMYDPTMTIFTNITLY